MASDDEMLRDGLRDTTESKRKYGGGRVMTPSEMGFEATLSDSMRSGSEPLKTPKPERDTYYDADQYFKRQEAARRRNRRGGAPTSGGRTVDPPKRMSLEQLADKMRAEYKLSGEAYLEENQPDAVEDFLNDEDAQMEFAESAALQDFVNNDASTEYIPGGDSAVTTYRIGDTDYTAFIFDDASEFLVMPGANMSDLQPGDILRVSPPSM